jgi:hypothetical protein
MAQHGDEYAIRVLGINQDGAELLAVTKAEMLPRAAAVS